jgi:adenylate cyclase class IV
MARNVEIKACLPASHAGLVTTRAQALATAPVQHLLQDDSFYACAQGRLKLRRFPDAPGPKTSAYQRTPVNDAEGLHAALSSACGLIGRVRKQRCVVMVGRTRVHLDTVEGLGRFLELEVVLRDDEPACNGIEEAEALMARLGIAPGWLVDGAYLDLLASGAGDGR